MKGYISNIEKESLENDYFRKVLYTGKNSQLVVMSLNPGEEIGEEVHKVDQFLRIEQGQGEAVLDGVSHSISDGFSIFVPAGTRHNVINGNGAMKLYTIYSPPQHLKDTVHRTKKDAEADEARDHFDGKTTE